MGFNDCIAIGHFGDGGQAPSQYDTDSKVLRIADGRDVEVRVVQNGNCGDFYTVVKISTDDGEGPNLRRTYVDTISWCSAY